MMLLKKIHPSVIIKTVKKKREEDLQDAREKEAEKIELANKSLSSMSMITSSIMSLIDLRASKEIENLDMLNLSREEFEKGKCLKKLEGSFCWRGVWEGRLYFPDEEYWGEEIAELSELYNDYILPWCKNFIKERDQHDYYD